MKVLRLTFGLVDDPIIKYLSIEGKLTLCKGVYCRHTSFAKEAVAMPFSQQPSFGHRASCAISCTADIFFVKRVLSLTVPAHNPTEMRHLDGIFIRRER